MYFLSGSRTQPATARVTAATLNLRPQPYSSWCSCASSSMSTPCRGVCSASMFTATSTHLWHVDLYASDTKQHNQHPHHDYHRDYSHQHTDDSSERFT